jgi:hypothetical protein
MSKIDLVILIIAPNSEMLIEGLTNELPVIKATDSIAVSFPITNADLEIQLRKKFISYNGLKDLDFNFSRFKLCDSKVPSTATSDKCIILFVSSNEKTKIEKDANLKFVSTYEDDVTPNKRKFNSKLTLGPTSQKFFNNFNFLTDKSGNPLDKCMNDAYKPKSTETIIYRFYRPIFPLPLFIRPGLYPYINAPFIVSPFVSPVQSRESSPRYNRYSRFSNEKMVAPVVPRSPSNSPRSPSLPRSVSPSRSRGGYYDKYLKYKLKYMKLKEELKNN